MVRSKLVDVVIPIFNEESCLAEMHRRITMVRNSSSGQLDLRAIYVDDGSNDSSSVLLQQIGEQDSWVTIVLLARNFGHQIAVTAGLIQSAGDYTVIIDGDLQDPPELIPALVEAISASDAHIVYGKRIARTGETWFKKKSASIFYKLIRKLSSVDIPLDTGDFRIMDVQAVATLLAMPERNRFLRGMIPWTGLKAIPFEYERESRHAGETKYTLKKMLLLAANAVAALSITPLRSIQLCSILLVTAGSLSLMSTSIIDFFGSVNGLIYIVELQVFVTGALMGTVGILGGYLHRIQDEVRDRPLFVLESIWKDGEKQ
jgi:glycosyltransferase involved in cell wall biosynthesis